MLIMHLVRVKDSLYTLPPEQRGKLMAGHFAFMEKYLKANKLKSVYPAADAKRGFTVWDLESSEEVQRLLLEYPMTPFIESEFVPIVEFGRYAQIMKEAMKTA